MWFTNVSDLSYLIQDMSGKICICLEGLHHIQPLEDSFQDSLQLMCEVAGVCHLHGWDCANKIL